MKDTLKIINQMLKQKLFKKYAIGGGIGAIFYIEPVTTFDLDIFIIMKEKKENTILLLTPIYDWLKKNGYKFKNEQIVIEGIPVQFIPSYNKLVKEAVENSKETEYNNVNTYVISKEYLIAIMLQTNRQKDRERMIKFMEQADVSDEILDSILKRHNLIKALKEFEKKYLNEK